MPDIKIFVSHRIDIDSELISNPLYIPMRCGAVFDRENPMGIAGDDTGDNISERRMSFCEFTVQYWAWKNAKADYIGLCHYRRYLSFVEKQYKTYAYNMIHEPEMLPSGKRRYGLLDREHMEKLISRYDIVTSESAEVSEIHLPQGTFRTVWELWEAHEGLFFEKLALPMLLELIDETAPAYSRSAREYLAGTKHRGFNCYVLRRELFERLCQLQFPIMFEIERRLDTSGYTQTMLRTPAFMGEILYGIFIYHVSTYESWRIKELQLVYFQNTERLKGPLDLLKRRFFYWSDWLLRAVVDPFCPKGTARRERLKDLFYGITGIKRRGPAKIK